MAQRNDPEKIGKEEEHSRLMTLAGISSEAFIGPKIFTGGPTMKQFMDIFSLPEMTLLSCVNDYFINHSIEYDPVHLFRDDAVTSVHVKGMMYNWIEQDLEKYILHGDETYAVLNRLVNNGKKLFLITNSPFNFVDKGMKHMVGKDWRDLFDLVIVQADKPGFFTDKRKPFRRLDDTGVLQWDKINRLEKGKMYKQGNLFDFLRLTGWGGSKVLYFGDHLYSDLAVSTVFYIISLSLCLNRICAVICELPAASWISCQNGNICK
ncbi:5'-nucleotidase domain-containing protein 2 [Rhincodon typus]|uniref:5'-nucleotidase domain-containing protein 2 n=1 Tax=Rhincodon typus TaxID=259920 RepID=UPI00202FCBC9|nr:5'-nucleotidase domain-containing protein 2 [Rhincodon typus]